MITDLVIGIGAGAAVGLVFFGGLRWTIDRLATSRRPRLLVVGSLVVRTVLLVAVLIALADGGFVRVVAALGGVLVARTAVVAAANRSDVEEAPWT